jgi:hypothetical protein
VLRQPAAEGTGARQKGQDDLRNHKSPVQEPASLRSSPFACGVSSHLQNEHGAPRSSQAKRGLPARNLGSPGQTLPAEVVTARLLPSRMARLS